MERYKQQVKLSEIGEGGQDKISSASVLIIGAGGLGTIAAGYLAAMGVGNIGICDFDIIEESNLHRQFLYAPNDIGMNKANVLSGKLQIQNPTIIITPFPERFSRGNAEILFENYKIICDCSDNIATRLLINEYCSRHRRPLIHGAVSGWQGYVTVFHFRQKYSYADLFDTKDLFRTESCEDYGINSAVCGIIGSYMATEALKVILDLETSLEGTLLYVNGLNNTSRYLKLRR